MGAYLPWITAVAVIAILVLIAMPMLKKKKPCACEKAAEMAAALVTNPPVTTVAPSSDITNTQVTADFATM